MATSATMVDIWNMALGFVGARTLASPDENTPEAIPCALFWDRARRSALRDFPYTFAQRRVRLAELQLPDVYADEWHHAYSLPDGCLKVHAVHGGRRNELVQNAWRIESDGETLMLLSNQECAFADCTMDVERVSMWDECFTMAIARKLASLICVPLLKAPANKVQELEQLYHMSIPKATGQDASERHSAVPDDVWLAARRSW